jgi:anti-sigma B factor antagonist
MSFEYQNEILENCLVIAFCGRFIDNQLDKKMIESVEISIAKNLTNFILDLEGLKYMNSTGINSLVRILSLANRAKGQVVIVNIPPRIAELLEVIKLNAVFSIKEDRQAGLAYINNRLQ